MTLKIPTYTLTQREICAKEINLITKLLNATIGEYNNIKDEYIFTYSNEYIAELIFINSKQITSLEDGEANKIIPIMAMFIKYMYAYAINDETSLKSIEEKVRKSQYSGVHYFLKQTLFQTSLTNDETVQVLCTLFKEENQAQFILAFNATKNLLEDTNQLYIQPAFYNKIEPSVKTYKLNFQLLKDTFNKKDSKKQDSKKR